MDNAKKLNVRIVPVPLAAALQNAAFGPLWRDASQTEGETRLKLAQALLTHLHNRHVGITPQLAAGFARWVTAPESAPFPWNEIHKRLLAGLGDERKDSGTSLSILLTQAPLYAALRIATPVITKGCFDLGENYLFAEDGFGAEVNAKAYEKYNDALAQHVAGLAQNTSPEWRLFWQERALTLSTFSLQGRGGNIDLDTLLRGDGREEAAPRGRVVDTPRAVLPEAEPFAASFFFQETRKITSNEPSRVVRRLVSIIQKYTTRRIREGGIRGIQLTRRMEDLDLILLSEFLNPPEILADRLLNTGYLAREREPKRERFRDFLLVAFMPARVGETLSAALVKFAWYQTLLGLSLVLRRSKLHASQFVWIEGDAQGGARRADFYLDQLKVIPPVGDQITNSYFRSKFLTLLQWLPSYLDARGAAEPLSPRDAGGTEGNPFDAEKQMRRIIDEPMYWAECAARHFRLAPLTNQFGFVHYMLFLPTALRANTRAAAFRGELAAKLGVGLGAGRNVSVTWIPARLKNGNEWGYWAKEKHTDQLLPQPLAQKYPGNSQEKIADELISLWLQEFIREIWSE